MELISSPEQYSTGYLAYATENAVVTSKGFCFVLCLSKKLLCHAPNTANTATVPGVHQRFAKKMIVNWGDTDAMSRMDSS